MPSRKHTGNVLRRHMVAVTYDGSETHQSSAKTPRVPFAGEEVKEDGAHEGGRCQPTD